MRSRLDDGKHHKALRLGAGLDTQDGGSMHLCASCVSIRKVNRTTIRPVQRSSWLQWNLHAPQNSNYFSAQRNFLRRPLAPLIDWLLFGRLITTATTIA